MCYFELLVRSARRVGPRRLVTPRVRPSATERSELGGASRGASELVEAFAEHGELLTLVDGSARLPNLLKDQVHVWYRIQPLR